MAAEDSRSPPARPANCPAAAGRAGRPGKHAARRAPPPSRLARTPYNRAIRGRRIDASVGLVMEGRKSKTRGGPGGLIAAAIAAACLGGTPDRIDDTFVADESGRRPYVTGLVASSIAGPQDAAAIGAAPFGGDAAFGVAVPRAAGDVRLELEARPPRADGGWATTANVWRDVEIGDRLGVYAGGGLGMGAGPAQPAASGGTALAWQAGAGATYALTPRVTLDVGYRVHGLEAARSPFRSQDVAGEVVMAVRIFEPLRGWLR